MTNKLQDYFPMIQTRESIMEQIEADRHLKSMFEQWGENHRQEFLDFCTGVRGVKPMYDFISKEILNPETVPERIDELLSLLLGQEVHIIEVLPGDSTRIADRHRWSLPSVNKGIHALNHDIWVIFCVVLNWRTSSTPQSSALKIAQISMVRVVESERNQFLFLQGT